MFKITVRCVDGVIDTTRNPKWESPIWNHMFAFTYIQILFENV